MAANPPQESPPPPQQTPPSTRRRPKFRGIRSRSGKWVSEIREPKKTTRIWLGTYPTPEKAAAAYDVAAIALKGPHTPLNFPTSFHSYPVPASTSPSDIRSAAATAAADWMPEPERNVQAQHQASGSYTRNEAQPSDSCSWGPEGPHEQEYMDEEDMLNMPGLLVEMAGGMMISPPRMNYNTTLYEDFPDNSEGESLWSFRQF
ncbi:Ethylene-responsive transcription factor ERF025 [Linum perenne]